MRFFRFAITPLEWLYVVKCIVGVLICYGFYISFPAYPFHWSIISSVLVFTPDNDQSLAFDRIKANFLGSSVGLLVYFIPLMGIFLFCIGVVLTILLGLILRLENTIRPALAAVIIVLVQENEHKEWIVALERGGCVLLGCFVSLCVTLVFTKVAWAKFYYKLDRWFRRK
ncbi:FUSC family protein [Olivibacter sp. SDN3]|uniref:FUSC family protein n=1 Tax=Olivibacter sp. SDN3 TaxID=2764720 RepID=UPI0016511BD1|nr:FUSC family protein [Olivibacter sp. SDN3]QNL49680.1 FUSC family protein [Olivibacter sp. SDN3]